MHTTRAIGPQLMERIAKVGFINILRDNINIIIYMRIGLPKKMMRMMI